MQLGSQLISRIDARSRPRRTRAFAVAAARGVRTSVVLLPLAAFGFRALHGPPAGATEALALWMLPLVLLPPCAGLVALLRRGGDPLREARALDASAGGGERLLSAVDAVQRRLRAPLLPLLIADADRTLSGLPVVTPRRARVRLPRLRTVVVALILTALILLVPGLGSGLLGPPESRDPDAVRAAGDADVEAPAPHEGGGSGAAGLAERVELRARTDARIYRLDDEIHLSLELKALENLPRDRRIDAVVVIDGRSRLALPLDWTLPAAEGETRAATVPLRHALEELGRHRAGPITFEARVELAEPEPGFAGEARAPAVTVHIGAASGRSESESAGSPQRRPDRRPEPKKQERPQEEPQERPLPRPQPAPEGPGERFGDVEAVERAVDPLFSGDETSKRRARVFDRGAVPDDRDPDTPLPRPEDRVYRKGSEIDVSRIPIPAAERGIVRRYLEGIGPRAGEKR